MGYANEIGEQSCQIPLKQVGDSFLLLCIELNDETDFHLFEKRAFSRGPKNAKL